MQRDSGEGKPWHYGCGNGDGWKADGDLVNCAESGAELAYGLVDWNGVGADFG